jgi:hypothetical protein
MTKITTGGIQDGRYLKDHETLSSMISEKYFRFMVASIGQPCLFFAKKP